MRKKLLLFLLIPLFAFGLWISPWQPVGNALQRSSDGYNFRFDLGSNRGFAYWYQKTQVDSLFLNVPTQAVHDSSKKAANMQALNNLANANAIYLSPLYFYGTGPSSDPIKVGNADSLGHQPPSYYSHYVFSGTNLQYTNGVGGYHTFPTAVSSFTNDAGYATVTQVKASLTTNLFGQTGSIANVGTYANMGSDNTFTVSGWVNLLAATSDSLKVQVTWTDGHAVSHTKVFKGVGVSSTGNMGAVDDYAFFTVCIRAAVSTNVVVSSTVTGAGSILYEVGCVVEKKVGNGGL